MESLVVKKGSVDVRRMLQLISCAFLLLACEGSRVVQPKRNSIKTVKTVDGDVFDCVHIYKQPAFDHPSLKDHKVQMKPSSFPEDLSDAAPENLISQFKLEGDEGCPDGYIPIQRIDRNDLVGETLDLGVRVPNPTLEDTGNVKNWWAVLQPRGDAWYGGGASLNVWNPAVGPTQLSASLIWMINRKANVLITAGWHVVPGIFHDNKTRLTIVWSNKSGHKATCFNLQCPGFVQTNRDVYLGSILSPISVYKGNQYVIRVYIFKDQPTGNWWFSFGSPTNTVGYWPQSLFPGGLDSLEEMQYGGFVGCHKNEFCPAMGNGDRAALDRVNNAAFVNEVKYAAYNSSMVELSGIIASDYQSDPNCYNLGDYSYASGFQYGGPGCF